MEELPSWSCPSERVVKEFKSCCKGHSRHKWHFNDCKGVREQILETKTLMNKLQNVYGTALSFLL